MKVHQAYRFELDPNRATEASLRSHCGASRFAYNWGLAQVKADLDARKENPNHASIGWSMPSLRKEWNRVKAEVAPWWAENSKEAYASGLQALSDALANWAQSKDKKGKRFNFPHKHKKNHHRSCRFTTGVIGVEDNRHVKLPVVGCVRAKERVTKLARHLRRSTGRIHSATVSRTADRWYVSFGCTIERKEEQPERKDLAAGVDVGIKTLAMVVDSEDAIMAVGNTRPLAASLSTLRRWCRRVSRRKKRSAGCREAKAKVAQCHARVANQRRDHWHKLTSFISKRYGIVVAEKLNVAGLMQNRRLARSLADAGLGTCRQQLAYKTVWRGGLLALADTFYPSSKTCSQCGAVKAKLPLRERVYRCDCGLVMDRDENAARNLVQLVTRSSPGTENARRLDVRLGLAKQPRKPRNPWKKREVGSAHSSLLEVAC